MTISACPKCGSKNISMGTMGSGVTFGVTSWNQMCRNCGYQGQPLLFDSEKKYKKFFEALHQKPQDTTERRTPGSVEEKVDEVLDEVSEKDKDTVRLLCQYEEESECKPIWPKNKAWWPEISIALVFTFLAYLSGFIGDTSRMGVEVVVFYTILYFGASFVIFLFFIVFFEYTIRTVIVMVSK